MNKTLKDTIIIILIVFGFLFLLNFSLFFGLQVSTTLGNIGLLLTFTYLLLAVLFWVRRGKKK